MQRLKNHHLPPPKQGAPRAFRLGIPAFDLFPFDVWAKLQAGFWRNAAPAQLGYGDPAGEPALRELIAAYLRRSRGLTCTAEQIVITSGAQQAISLCAQLLLQPGDRVAVENPGYRAAAHAFSVAGAEVAGVPVDEEGMDCARLGQLRGCRLAYVTPAHQYPTGVTMSLARRLALLGWAERNDGWIIEDDYDGEYRYSGAPWPRWLHSTGPAVCCTWAPSARSPSRRCAWVTWCCRRSWHRPSARVRRWQYGIRRSAASV